MAKHTPGPWRYRDPIGENQGNEEDYFEIQSQHEKYDAPAINLTGFMSEADACLIAAAPDLLTALESCPLPSTMGTAAEHYQRFYDWYQGVAVPAIQKAGGLA